MIVVQIETKGKTLTIIKNSKSFQVQDSEENDLKNVHFIHDEDALIKFNERLETITQ